VVVVETLSPAHSRKRPLWKVVGDEMSNKCGNVT
jgi:hypothetical protein